MMTNKQRIKLTKLLKKTEAVTIRLLNDFSSDRSKPEPLCYVQTFVVDKETNTSHTGLVEGCKAYIDAKDGEILRFEFGDLLWDSSLNQDEVCPDRERRIIDIKLLKQADRQSNEIGKLLDYHDTGKERNKIRKLMKEIALDELGISEL